MGPSLRLVYLAAKYHITLNLLDGAKQVRRARKRLQGIKCLQLHNRTFTR